MALRDNPVLFGSAFLAYAFGLRHAVDADHIAAIDNATRKLMQWGERPIGVGLFFSLGHSGVVVLLSVAVVFAASQVSARFELLKTLGGSIGPSVSAFFLFLLALFNVVALARRSSAANRSRKTTSTFFSTAAAFWRGYSGLCSSS